MNVFVFNESGKGYWMPGFGCLRAEGENRPSRPSNCVVQWEEDEDGLPVCPKCGKVALQRANFDVESKRTYTDFVLSNFCPECGEKLKDV